MRGGDDRKLHRGIGDRVAVSSVTGRDGTALSRPCANRGSGLPDRGFGALDFGIDTGKRRAGGGAGITHGVRVRRGGVTLSLAALNADRSGVTPRCVRD